MQLKKTQAVNLPTQIDLGQGAKMQIPSFCDLMVNSKVITTTTTKSPYLNLKDDQNCTNKIVTLKVFNIFYNLKLYN